MNSFSLIASSLVLLVNLESASAQDMHVLTKEELLQVIPGSTVSSTGFNAPRYT